MYAYLTYLFPKRIKNSYIRLLRYFNVGNKADFILGMLLIFGTGLALSISLLASPYVFVNYSKFISFLILFPAIWIVVQLAVYFIIYYIADKNGKFVDNILPDALQLMASNLRAGMTIERALLVSTRKEFSTLNVELIRVGKEVATGEEISNALRDMSTRIMSEKLRKTVELIVLGLSAGGELSTLLEEIAENLRQQHLIEEKIKANVTIYIIFIAAATGFGAPMLFGMSSFLVKVITTNLKAIEMPTSGMGRVNLPFSITEVNITSDFIATYAVVTLVTGAVMASFVIGLIKSGKERGGIIYIPFFVIFSLGVYLVISFVINYMFSSLLTVA